MRAAFCFSMFLFIFSVHCATKSRGEYSATKSLAQEGLLSQSYPVALTFDDLPSSNEVVLQVVETLKKHEVPEVYGFLNGGIFEVAPHLKKGVSAWAEAGFPLGNHTASHLDLESTSVKKYIEDIYKNEKYLAELSLGMRYKAFRYPYIHEGSTLEKREDIRRYLASEGYDIIQVTVDAQDWAWTNSYNRCLAKKDGENLSKLEELFLEHAVKRFHLAREQSLALFHRNIPQIAILHASPIVAKVLDTLLKKLKAEVPGIQFQGLTSVLKDDVYRIDPKVLMVEGMTFLEQLFQSRGLPGIAQPTIPFELLNTICL